MSTSTPTSSRFRTSTPVKAKPSTLVNRSSPSLPPASQAYEPQVKSVLRYRLSSVFVRSALLCWAVNTVWVVGQAGGVGVLGISGVVFTPFWPLTIVNSVLLWIAAVVPAIVLRKVFLTSQRTSPTSPQNAIASAWVKPSTKTAFVTYVASAIALAFIHAAQSDSSARLTVFVKSKKHPQYLNGRLLFLLVSQATLASIFLFRNALRDRFTFRWVGMMSGKPSLVMGALSSLVGSIVTVTTAIPLACTLFGLTRIVVLPLLYKIPFLSIFLRPFTAHFLRGPYTLSLPFQHVPMLTRTWAVGLTTSFLWEAAETMFDGMLGEPVSVGASSPTLLVSGTSSNDPMMKYYAYAELSQMTASSVPNRQALFGDQNNVPNVWGVFVREALLLLGKDYQRLLGRGKEPAPSAPAVASIPAKPSAPALPGTPIPLLRQSILRARPESPTEFALDTFGSDGPLAKVVDETTEATHIPELFRSVSTRPLKTVEAVKSTAVAVTTQSPAGILKRTEDALMKRVKGLLTRHAPAGVKEQVDVISKWWTEERLSRKVDACLPMRELDVVVIEVLTKLVCSSLTEDRFGNVQRDIPKILEALISFLTAVEQYQLEIRETYSPDTLPKDTPKAEYQAVREEFDRATDVLTYVGDGLKDGVARIVRTFGDRLTAFKFPPRTAAKLQSFMDFCQ